MHEIFDYDKESDEFQNIGLSVLLYGRKACLHLDRHMQVFDLSC